MMQKGRLMSMIASIGIGAAAYQMMKPNNRMGQSIKNRMNKMTEQKQMFPNS